MQGKEEVDAKYLPIIFLRILIIILVNSVKEDEVNATDGYFESLALLEK